MKKVTLTTREYLVPFVLVTTLFFLWGFARAILDVLNKHFQETLNVDITQSAWIQVVTYLGYFLMAIPAGMFINRYGYRRGVVFGLTLFAAGAFLFIPSSAAGAFSGFLGCLFIIACGLAFLETSANPYATQLGSPETATSRLNLSQSFNGMGSFLAPLIVGSFLFNESASAEADIAMPYMVMGIVVVVIAVVFSFVRLPEIVNEKESSASVTDVPSSMQSLRHLFSLRQAANHAATPFLLALSALLCYEIGEISINSYFVNFTTDMGLLSSSTASYILSLALVVFMIGRFLGSALMLVIRPALMLLICASGSLVCMAMVLLAGTFAQQGVEWAGTASLVFLILNYLFESIMFPTIFSLALTGLGLHTKAASSLLMMTPVGGCFFLLVAWMADHTSPVIPFVIPLLAFLVVWIFAWRCKRVHKG